LLGFTGGNPTSMQINTPINYNNMLHVNLSSENIITPGLVKYTVAYSLPTLARPLENSYSYISRNIVTLINGTGSSALFYGDSLKLPPGALSIKLQYRSGVLCDVYVYLCEFAEFYYMKYTWRLANRLDVPGLGNLPHATLRNNAPHKYSNSTDWRLLGTIAVTNAENFPFKSHIGVNNGAGISKEITLNIKTNRAATEFTGWEITVDKVDIRNFNGTITEETVLTNYVWYINSNVGLPYNNMADPDFIIL
jgi:hypothetical protein